MRKETDSRPMDGHELMLKDAVRTDTYRRAIEANHLMFKGEETDRQRQTDRQTYTNSCSKTQLGPTPIGKL